MSIADDIENIIDDLQTVARKVDREPQPPEVQFDRTAIEDAIERRFPCPDGTNRIDHQRQIVDLADDIITLIDVEYWDED